MLVVYSRALVESSIIYQLFIKSRSLLLYLLPSMHCSAAAAPHRRIHVSIDNTPGWKCLFAPLTTILTLELRKIVLANTWSFIPGIRIECLNVILRQNAYMHEQITKGFRIMNTCISRFGIRIGDRKYLNEYTPFGSVSL